MLDGNLQCQPQDTKFSVTKKQFGNNFYASVGTCYHVTTVTTEIIRSIEEKICLKFRIWIYYIPSRVLFLLVTLVTNLIICILIVFIVGNKLVTGW